MKRRPLRTIPLIPRILLPLLWGGLSAAFLAAPLLHARGHFGAAALLNALFSPVCHQDPGRSFTFCGQPWAVCHRCSGIYFGLFLGSLLPFELSVILDSPRRRRFCVLLATLPLLLDALMPLSGIWLNTPVSRLATGLLFGIMISSLLGPGLGELLGGFRWKRNRFDANAVGGFS
jgi:uncharacterized membrane protein